MAYRVELINGEERVEFEGHQMWTSDGFVFFAEGEERTGCVASASVAWIKPVQSELEALVELLREALQPIPQPPVTVTTHLVCIDFGYLDWPVSGGI